MGFKEFLNEEQTYKEFFAKKLEKYGVKSPSELSDEDKQKFYDEVDAEWEGENEED
jgi:lipase chaperone LimK